MKRTRVRINPGKPQDLPAGRVNYAVLDGTTERDLALQQQHDDAEAMQDMAKFARRVRKRLGFTQQEFARAHRRATRDDPQLGTGKTLPHRRRSGVAPSA